MRCISRWTNRPMSVVLRRLAIVLVPFLLAAFPPAAAEAAPDTDLRRPAPSTVLAQAQPPSNDGFEPINEIPPEDQMPAAPMVVAAYSVVMIAFFLYVLSLSKRLGAVKQDIARLEAEQKRTGRA